MKYIIAALTLMCACLPACSQTPQPSWAVPGLSTGINYPNGAQPLTASATGTTGAVAATLAASATRLTWICGFVVTSGGTTAAAVGNVTITGVIGGAALNFAYVAVSSGQGVLGVAFPQCLPGTGANTPIVVNMPAAGAGTQVAAVTAWGFQF